MAGEWRSCSLGEVIELKRGYDLPQQGRRPGTVPLVSSSGITDHHAEAMVKGPGVVTGRYGTLGQVFYIDRDFWPLNTALYVRDFKGNDPRFISYFLRGIDFQAYSDKAAVPGLNRNHIHQAQVVVPTDIEEQRAIAGILGAFDDRIEVNNRRVKALEATAWALFRSWFVDFDPVRTKIKKRNADLPRQVEDLFPIAFEESNEADIPKGWTACGLNEIAQFLNGLALQRFPPKNGLTLPVIKIAQLRVGTTVGADLASAEIESKYIVEDGDVLFSWSGSLECTLWGGGRGALNQHLFKVTSTKYPKWLYYLWIHHHLADFRHIAASKATTMGHIQRHHLSAARCVVPPADILAKMNRYFLPLIDLIPRLHAESRVLSLLRDELLPKLISGALPVRNGASLTEPRA